MISNIIQIRLEHINQKKKKKRNVLNVLMKFCQQRPDLPSLPFSSLPLRRSLDLDFLSRDLDLLLRSRPRDLDRDLDRPLPFFRLYKYRRSSREIGFKCMKLQNPERVHSLKIHICLYSLVSIIFCNRVSLPHFILATACLAEIGNGRKLSINRPTAKPTIVQIIDCLFRILLPAKLDVDIPN